MLTKLKIYFWTPDANFFYGHKYFVFPRLCRYFQKWTFINVQNRFSETLLGNKNLRFYIY
jgi:hypothetical protein